LKHCTYDAGAEWKPPGWYQSGWSQHRYGGAPMTYRDYLRAIGRHYRHENQILFWQLMNEAEIYPDTGAHFRILRQFARHASAELKATGITQPLSLGLLGLGQPATTGPRFRQLHDWSQLDVVTAHDHGYMNEPLPGKDWPRLENSLFSDLLAARALRKPFVVTEAGIPLEWVTGDRALRAELFRQKIQAVFAAGGRGYILWNYEPTPVTNYGFGPEDPILPMLRDASATLGLE
jgi:hypothetical protein